MRSRLRWLDLALLALLGWGGWAALLDYREAADRDGIFETGPAGSAPVSSADLPKAAPAQAEAYRAIADRMLFSADRTAAVRAVTREAGASTADALPVLHGIADLGEGPSALLAERPGMRAQWVRPGEVVGPYQLESIGRDRLVLSRNGRRIEATATELRNPASRTARTPRVGARTGLASTPVRSVARPSTARPANGRYRIGTEFRPGRFAADASDGAVDGTEYNGYVRRVQQSPFGAQHWWEKQEP